uniref:VM domain-containing protein n=1 Tax=Strongyloides stercoralis TaxID=6248 RepID=A0A0K0DXU8_STRER
MEVFTITLFLVFFINIYIIQGFIFGNSGGSNYGCQCNPQPLCSPSPPCAFKQIPPCGSNPNVNQYVSRQTPSSYFQPVSSYASEPLSIYSSQPSLMSYPYQQQTSMQTDVTQPPSIYSVASKPFYPFLQSNYLNTMPQSEFVSSSTEKSYLQSSVTPSSYGQSSREYRYKAKKKYTAGAKIHTNKKNL